ncbi:MAG TPA: hypothetical protein VHP33_30090 [Polyangiaceae bacterium]|nr:hypothetical protein [Polyangiaceae bacterium]
MRLLAPKPLFALLIALAPALQAPPLVAAEPTPSELSVARRLFDEGRTAEDAARWSEAADKFRRATAIKDTPGLRFHLARCQEEQGAFVEALVEYDRARELIDSGVRAADVEKLLAEARERVRAKLAQLTLRLPSDVQNVSVELDGKALSASVLGVPMPINPGKHQVSAVAVGRARFATELTLGMGEVRQLPIELPVASSAPAAPATPAARPAARSARVVDDTTVPTRTIVLIGEASLFAAALGTGIVFSVARSSASDRYDRANATVLSQLDEGDDEGSACAQPLEGCVALNEARDDRVQAGRIAAGGFIAAGISAAAFGVTYFLWPRADSPIEVGATARPGGLSMAVSGRF